MDLHDIKIIVYIICLSFVFLGSYKMLSVLQNFLQKKLDFYNSRKAWEENRKTYSGVNPVCEEIPKCFKKLGFKKIPESEEILRKQYLALSKKHHPDMGGTEQRFQEIHEAYTEAKKIMRKKKG